MGGPNGRDPSRTFRTRMAAEAYEREVLAQRDRGGWVDPRAGRITLAEWVTESTDMLASLRPSSRRIYLDNLRLHVLPSSVRCSSTSSTRRCCERGSRSSTPATSPQAQCTSCSGRAATGEDPLQRPLHDPA